MLTLITESLKRLKLAQVSTLSAALSFFSILSLAPLITISIAIAGLFLSRDTIENQIVPRASEVIGLPATALVRSIVDDGNSPTPGGIVALMSFGVLLYGASRIFWQLRLSLNVVWGLTPGIHASIKGRLLAMAYVLIAGIFLAGAVMFNALGATLLIGTVRTLLSGFAPIAWLLSLLIAPITYFIIFAAVFRFLPGADISWSCIWPGAAMTAALFWIGNYLIWLGISYNFARTATSFYGAAGSVIVLLLWVYASAWIFLFGAKLIQVYAERRGTPIVPHSSY